MCLYSIKNIKKTNKNIICYKTSDDYLIEKSNDNKFISDVKNFIYRGEKKYSLNHELKPDRKRLSKKYTVYTYEEGFHSYITNKDILSLKDITGIFIIPKGAHFTQGTINDYFGLVNKEKEDDGYISDSIIYVGKFGSLLTYKRLLKHFSLYQIVKLYLTNKI